MKMRSVIGAAAAMVMVCSMAACGSEKLSAEELYAKALETGKQDMEMELSSSTSTMGMTVDTVYNIKTKQDDDTLEFAMSGEIMGMQMDMYYTDGWMYMDLGDMGKMKAEADEETANKYFGQMSGSESSLLEADVADFSELTAGEDEDGNTVLTYTLPADKVAEYMDSAQDMLGEDMEDIVITYGDMTGTITFNDDNEMIKQSQNVTMSMEMEGMTMDTESTTEYVIKAVGEDVKITYPDFSDFEEVDSSDFEEVDSEEFFGV